MAWKASASSSSMRTAVARVCDCANIRDENNPNRRHVRYGPAPPRPRAPKQQWAKMRHIVRPVPIIFDVKLNCRQLHLRERRQPGGVPAQALKIVQNSPRHCRWMRFANRRDGQ